MTKVEAWDIVSDMVYNLSSEDLVKLIMRLDEMNPQDTNIANSGKSDMLTELMRNEKVWY